MGVIFTRHVPGHVLCTCIDLNNPQMQLWLSLFVWHGSKTLTLTSIMYCHFDSNFKLVFSEFLKSDPHKKIVITIDEPA